MNRLAIGVFSAVACALVPSSSAHAATVYVLIQGTVEYNQFVSGTFAGVPAGAPVVMRIKLDSTQFLNDPNGLPTRGYRFDYTKFAMTAGGVTAYLTPSVTTAYFVLRNNDPHVDGMFISTGTANDVELPLQITPSGYGIGWKWTFNGQTTLNSLNLLDALGEYGYPNISVFNWAVQFGEVSYPMYFDPPTSGTSFALCLPGDTNADHVTDVNDIPSFVDALLNGSSALYASCAADMNQDGSIDGADVQAFTNCIMGGCP